LKLRLATRYTDADGCFRNNGNPVPGFGNLPPMHRDFSPRKIWIVRARHFSNPTTATPRV
jgi:hypothetical protein